MFGSGYAAETPAGQIIILFATVLTIAIFLRAILSWFQMDRGSPLIQLLDTVTEPILDPIRRIMPRLGMIDLSPLVAILVLNVVGRILAQLADGNL
jgi:YggT family protein